MVIDIPEVQPFAFQATTAFQERKELADKLNEVIDVLNMVEDVPELQSQIDALRSDVTALQEDIGNTDTSLADLVTKVNGLIETVNSLTSRVAALETSSGQAATDISDLKSRLSTAEATIATHETEITAAQSDISEMDTEITALLHEVVNEVSMASTAHGTVQVTIHHEDGSQDTSAPIDLALVQEGGITLQTGATDRSFNLKVTLSDGSAWQTNDFVIPEGGGTEVSVTSIQIAQGTQSNMMKVRIGLSDGSFIDSNDWTVVTPSEFGTLQTTVEGQAGDITALDTRVQALEDKPGFALNPATATTLGGVKIGTNITVASDGTISIPNASSSAAGVMTPAQVSSLNAAATAATMMFQRDASTGLQLHFSSVAGSEFDEQVPTATPALPGVMSAADKTKLDAVPAPATIATDEDISDIQEQITGLKLSKSGDNNIILNGDSIPAISSVSPTIVEGNTLRVEVNGVGGQVALPSGDSFTHTVKGQGDTELKAALESLPLYTFFIYEDDQYPKHGSFQKVSDDYCLGSGIMYATGKNRPFLGFNLTGDPWPVGQLNFTRTSDGSIILGNNSLNPTNWTIIY